MSEDADSAADCTVGDHHMWVSDLVHFGAAVRSGDTSRLSELYLKNLKTHTFRPGTHRSENT